MDHGTAFDNNVLATLCTKILPVHFPLLVHAEIGSAVLNNYYTEDGQCKTNGNSDHVFALVSTDGVLINKNTVVWSDQSDFTYSLEFKSPYFNKEPHAIPPNR